MYIGINTLVLDCMKKYNRPLKVEAIADLIHQEPVKVRSTILLLETQGIAVLRDDDTAVLLHHDGSSETRAAIHSAMIFTIIVLMSFGVVFGINLNIMGVVITIVGIGVVGVVGVAIDEISRKK